MHPKSTNKEHVFYSTSFKQSSIPDCQQSIRMILTQTLLLKLQTFIVQYHGLQTL